MSSLCFYHGDAEPEAQSNHLWHYKALRKTLATSSFLILIDRARNVLIDSPRFFVIDYPREIHFLTTSPFSIR